MSFSGACHPGHLGVYYHHPACRGAAGSVSAVGHDVNLLLSLRCVVMEGLVCTVVTASTRRCHGQLELKLVEAGTALMGSARDVAVGDAVANTHNHEHNVMRIVRIVKRIDKPADRPG